MVDIEITGEGCAKGALIGAGAILAGVALCSLMGNIWSNRYGRCPQIYFPRTSISRPASPRADNKYSLAKNFEKTFPSDNEDCRYLEFSNDRGERTIEAMFDGREGIRAIDFDGDGRLDSVLYFPEAKFDWKGENLKATHGQRAYKINARDAALNDIAREILDDAQEAFDEGDTKAKEYEWYGERIE